MSPEATPTMSHRAVLQALSGLMLGMFVAILSSTVVTTSLPRIVSDLGGSQSSYTWVVTSTLLALTVSTPIWGKLADLYDRKLLVQLGLTIYVLGSILGGLAQSMEWLIGCRVIQGLGVGGLTALVQVILSDLVSPRERGRYAGYLGAVFGVGTVAGPLLGGVLTDAFGWRSCFYVGVPFAVVALVLLQRTLDLPRRRLEVHLDYAGAFLIAAGVSSLLIWVSLAGHDFSWASTQTVAFLLAGTALLTAAYRVERTARQPLIPLSLFKNRAVVIATLCSVCVGTAMFGTTVFLSQYMQLARGMSPTESGLLTIPMVFGLFLASTIIGRRISRTGRYKRWMVLGAGMLTAGLLAMGTMDETTSLVELGLFMLVLGGGIGMLMQNLVLVVQNAVEHENIGAGSSLVAMMRSLGGAIGVSALGAVLATHVASSVGTSAGGKSGAVPDLSTLPEPAVRVVEHAYGTGIAEVFLLAAPLGLVVFLALLTLEENPLGSRSGIEIARERAAAQAPTPTPA